MTSVNQSELCILKRPRDGVLSGGNWRRTFEMIVHPSASQIGNLAEMELGRSTRRRVLSFIAISSLYFIAMNIFE